MILTDIVENADVDDVACAIIAQARLGSSWKWWSKVDLNDLRVALDREVWFAKRLDAFLNDATVNCSLYEMQQARGNRAIRKITPQDFKRAENLPAKIPVPVKDAMAKSGAVIDLKPMANVEAFGYYATDFVKKKDKPAPKPRDRSKDKLRVRASRSKAAIEARKAAKAAGLPPPFIPPVTTLKKAIKTIHEVQKAHRAPVVETRPTSQAMLDELAKAETGFRDDRSPITPDMAFAAPTGTPLYRPDPPPEMRNVELHTAELLGDPPAHRSALAARQRGDA